MAGLCAWLVPFGVYCISLNRAVGYWDTGEAQVVPWILGIAHPTGFPAYTLLGWAFAHALPIGTVAMRLALFSALVMSVAAWLVFRIVRELSDDAAVAVAAAWMFAFGLVAWTRGTRAEVHALAVMFALLTLYCVQRWYRTGEPRVFIAGAAAWGLGIATHPIVALMLPALLLVFVARIRRLRARTFAAALSVLIAAVGLYAYLPLRSAVVFAQRRDPTLTLGIAPGRPFWDNNHPSSWHGFVQEISGSEFGTAGVLSGILSPAVYAANGPAYVGILVRELTPLGALLALAGFVVLVRREPWIASSFALAALVPTAFGLAYSLEADQERYYLLSFAIAAVFAGYAAAAAARAERSLRVAAAATLAVAAIALLVMNRNTFAQWNSPGAQAVISSALAHTPANAILIAPWLYATPLAYGAYVERSLGHRIVETAWLVDDASRVPEWTKTRPVYVVGIIFGSVPGYHLVSVGGDPSIFAVVKN